MTTAELVRAGNLKPEHLIEKAKPLMLAKSEPPFTLGELKVLDTYLSRINARDPEHRRVRFFLKEYAELMGLDRIRPELMQTHIDALYDKKVEIYDDRRPDRKDSVHLFERRTLDKDENEQWWVELTCTESARELFFSLENIQYFKYYLANVINLGSMYSYRLYMYLLTQSFRGTWTIGMDDMRKALDCTAPRYEENKYFNSEVVKPAVAEVNEKTDMRFDCEPFKVGRKIAGLKFTMKPAIIELEEPEEEEAGESDIPDMDDPLGMVISVLPKELTREQAEDLRDLAIKWVPYEVMNFQEKEEWISDYIQGKVRRMKAQLPPVTHPYGWLRKAVDEDWK